MIHVDYLHMFKGPGLFKSSGITPGKPCAHISLAFELQSKFIDMILSLQIRCLGIMGSEARPCYKHGAESDWCLYW